MSIEKLKAAFTAYDELLTDTAASRELDDAADDFTYEAFELMPQLLEAVELLKQAREQYMRHQCDASIDVHEFFAEMQGVLAGDVCSETLEALGEK